MCLFTAYKLSVPVLQKLFPFVRDLHETSNLLLRAISKLEEHQRTDSAQVHLLISDWFLILTFESYPYLCLHLQVNSTHLYK